MKLIMNVLDLYEENQKNVLEEHKRANEDHFQGGEEAIFQINLWV